MVLGTGVLSRRFCRPFWRGPFGYLTSPPWKVKPAKVVTKQKKTACYCSGIRAAKSLRDINRVGVISKVQNSVYRIPRFKVNDMPDSTLLVHLPIEHIINALCKLWCALAHFRTSGVKAPWIKQKENTVCLKRALIL